MLFSNGERGNDLMKAMPKLVQLIKEICSMEYNAEKIVSLAIRAIPKYPGQLYSLVNDEKRDLCIEFDSVEYKAKENIYGSNPDIDDYCLVLIINDDVVYDKYFTHDITDEMMSEIKQIWNGIRG